MTRFIDGLERIATESGLSIPVVRYWAETRGELLGIRPIGDGDWRFSPQAVGFFQRLAREYDGGIESDTPEPTETAPIPPSADPEGETAELLERFTEMELQIADLLEETKQVQQLLSKLIQLLTPTSPSSERPRIVRPFKPRRLSTRTDLSPQRLP